MGKKEHEKWRSFILSYFFLTFLYVPPQLQTTAISLSHTLASSVSSFLSAFPVEQVSQGCVYVGRTEALAQPAYASNWIRHARCVTGEKKNR